MNDAPTEVDQPQTPPREFRRFMKLRRWHAIAIAAVAVCLFLLSGGLLNFPTTGGLKFKAGTALSTATSLKTAISAFFDEYGVLPGEKEQLATDSPEGIRMLIELHGTVSDPKVSKNLKSIRFLSVPKGKDMRGGMIYDSSGKVPAGLYDSWGNPYVVVLDTDFDERLQFQWGDQSVDLKGRRAAVFSAGPDRKLGTSDDIRTW